MINVRLYKEIIVPIFAIKHGQFAAVALTRSGANKLRRKVWESFINKRDRIVLREHQKVVNSQRKFDSQLLIAQQSAGQQIDNRVDQNLVGLDAKVKSIIKDTVKSQAINPQSFRNSPHPISAAFKRNRQTETIDLHSPNYGNKRQDFGPDFIPKMT